jgi:Flp pilus assembly protein TadG
VHRRVREDRGSAIAESMMAIAPLMLLVLALMQIASAMYVRNSLTLAATESARVAAISGDLALARERAHDLVSGILPGISLVEEEMQTRTIEGVSVMEVRLRARLPLIGPLGPRLLTGEGRAVMEEHLWG